MKRVTLLFFRGCTLIPDGIVKCTIPFLIRLCTWPRGRVHFNNVPAHVAIVVNETEYESIVTGIRKIPLKPEHDGKFYGLHNLIAQIQIEVGDGLNDKLIWFLNAQVGQRYGYEAVAITGIGNLRGEPPAFTKRIWEKLSSGRSAPKSCSYLCQLALQEIGIDVKRHDNLPMSPMDLLDAVRKYDV
jgi:hypothetical protein